ncbi:hypothetical protein [uncultured Streptomyces sp.]|uniref:hypothetical protein n=1 Tax=uncultured Streptomyces sp. TaxID=174707 RepID=UPI002612F1DE|nr:hypothetical protein [uncultured Streptomyces sp.]
MAFTKKISAAAVATAALLGAGLAGAAPASAAGPTGCSSWSDSAGVKGYADCTGGAGSVRVVVTCINYRGISSTHSGSWVTATSSAASVYSCGGETAWVQSTTYQTSISIG